MSTNALAQAVADARESEAQAAQLAQILAVVQAVQAATPAAHSPAACSCSHGTAPAPRRSAGKVAAWVAGGAACACVLTGLFLAVALVAVALTVGFSVSYLLVREIRKGK
jgi:ferric-dicitrate binding protein FerR (iron transport regulator)